MSKLKGIVAACALVLTASTLLAGVCTGSARAGGVVFFVDAQHGWESTYSGDSANPSTARATAWHTVDGGTSWKQQATRAVAFTGGGMWGGFFAFATRSTGIWVRAGHKVLRTTNAGASWQSVGWVAKTWLNDASFATKRVGWACSQFGSAAEGASIVKTSNAGATWHVQKRISGSNAHAAFYQVSCPTSRNCYVRGWVYDHGRSLTCLWATADGGKHWARRRLPSDVASIDFPTATSGWAVGSTGLMYATMNGGRTWHYVDSGTQEDLWDVSFCNSRVGYAVGTSGAVLRTTDAGATWVALGAPILAGSDYGAVACVDATHTWIIDGYGYGNVFATSDGGETWEGNFVYPPSNDGE